MKAIKAHGGWIKHMGDKRCLLILAYDKEAISTDESCMNMQELFVDYVFADDGSTCGVLVEE
jgi:hypothetical protein